jgi:hypothetical protein
VGENDPTVGRALNCLTEGVQFGAKPSPPAAIRLPSADPDMTRDLRPPPGRDVCGRDAGRRAHVVSRHLEHTDGQTDSVGRACARSPEMKSRWRSWLPPWDVCSQRRGGPQSTRNSSETSASKPPAPSLPSMHRWFATSCGTLRSRARALVRGAAEGGWRGGARLLEARFPAISGTSGLDCTPRCVLSSDDFGSGVERNGGRHPV